LPEEENVDDTAEQEQRLEQRANNLVPSLKKVLDKLTTTVSVSYKLSREQKKSYIDEIASIRALLKHKNLSQDPVGGVQRVEREWDEITQKLRNLGVQC
jgi:hypothetical protein